MTINPPKKSPAHSVMGRVRTSYPRILRLLVPLDFSGKSRQALRYAVPLAQKFAARIVLLHVVSPAAGRAPGATTMSLERIRQKNDALTRLDGMAVRFLPRSVRSQNLVRFGRPAEAILTTADQIDADMIVMTTHGRTGLNRFFLGSTAEQVMRRAGCPVFSVRRH
jgi:nucleotide-binding universal stress UspA family protein